MTPRQKFLLWQVLITWYTLVSGVSLISIVTILRAGQPQICCSIPCMGQEIFVSSEAFRQALDPTRSASEEIHTASSIQVNVIEV